MDRQTFESFGEEGLLNVMTQAFSHQHKKERGKGITLSDSSRRPEGTGGDAINENGEKGGRYEAHHLAHLHR